MVTAKKRNWKEYDESLVRRGELLFDTDFLSGWKDELRKINDGKEGARYRYPSSLMSMLAAIHVYLLPYRQLEGFVRTLSERVEELGSGVPDFTTIYYRISNMNVELDPDVDPNQDVTIAVDATGIKVSNRGEWIRHKWKVQRGFVKVHLAVDTKTGKIISMEVTRESVADGRMLKPSHSSKRPPPGPTSSRRSATEPTTRRTTSGHWTACGSSLPSGFGRTHPRTRTGACRGSSRSSNS